jgi:putative YhbY family RNA-binding protein
MSQLLTPADRKNLKAAAHALDPVVIIGDAGLTAGVLAEIERSLAAHELIKVRVTGDDRDARIALRDRIASELAAAPVQTIGKLLVFYRKRPIDTEALFRPQRPARKTSARKVSFNPAYKVSSRKVKTETSPPRTARIRKSGQRSGKKAFQNR